MAAQRREDFFSDFKRFFLRGLVILLPSVLTLWILVQAYLFVEAQVAEPINRGIRAGVLLVIPKVVPEESLPGWFEVTDEEKAQYRATLAEQRDLETIIMPELDEEALVVVIRRAKFKQFWDSHWYFRFIGIFVAIVLIYLAGVLLGGFIGRRIYGRLERLLTRVPVFKQVYPHVKQLVDMILGESPMAFRKAVLVQYPRKGVWTIGLLTSNSMRSVRDAAGSEMRSVFIPSTPTPFTGFTINVPAEDVVDLQISIDEAIRFFITGGALVPDKEKDAGDEPLEATAKSLKSADSANEPDDASSR